MSRWLLLFLIFAVAAASLFVACNGDDDDDNDAADDDTADDDTADDDTADDDLPDVDPYCSGEPDEALDGLTAPVGGLCADEDVPVVAACPVRVNESSDNDEQPYFLGETCHGRVVAFWKRDNYDCGEKSAKALTNLSSAMRRFDASEAAPIDHERELDEQAGDVGLALADRFVNAFVYVVEGGAKDHTGVAVQVFRHDGKRVGEWRQLDADDEFRRPESLSLTPIGTEFFFSWYAAPSGGGDGKIYARRFGTDGEPVGDQVELPFLDASVYWATRGDKILAVTNATEGVETKALSKGMYAYLLNGDLELVAGPTLLEDGEEYSHRPTFVEWTGDDEFRVVEIVSRDEGYDIAARLYHADGTPNGDEAVLVAQPDAIFFPRVVSDPDGGLTVVWANGVEDARCVQFQARSFAADFTPTGDAKTLLYSDSYNQSRYSAARLSNGRLALAFGAFDGAEQCPLDTYLQLFDEANEAVCLK
ncbi:MAG: hypothetical protein H6684_08195 [Deltaproteobacteria bacterium]|nr:hypothetical protein [Deltaproteobacteria bacterium]MCB9488696.1 hypothetical protein [Deltaproteobacteria bacterium]